MNRRCAGLLQFNENFQKIQLVGIDVNFSLLLSSACNAGDCNRYQMMAGAIRETWHSPFGSIGRFGAPETAPRRPLRAADTRQLSVRLMSL
jgi:hypothetical protein